jgi:glycosyltransferase involved in cell wall biosynthesis
LIVVGSGPERRRLQGMSGPTVRFTGQLPRAELIRLFEGCHAYVLPGEEDFGIAPVEALACGKPVIAYGRGGATETVRDGVDGVMFSESSANSLAAAVERLDGMSFEAAGLRARAEMFDAHHFRRAWRDLFAQAGVSSELFGQGD